MERKTLLSPDGNSGGGWKTPYRMKNASILTQRFEEKSQATVAASQRGNVRYKRTQLLLAYLDKTLDAIEVDGFHGDNESDEKNDNDDGRPIHWNNINSTSSNRVSSGCDNKGACINQAFKAKANSGRLKIPAGSDEVLFSPSPASVGTESLPLLSSPSSKEDDDDDDEDSVGELQDLFSGTRAGRRGQPLFSSTQDDDDGDEDLNDSILMSETLSMSSTIHSDHHRHSRGFNYPEMASSMHSTVSFNEDGGDEADMSETDDFGGDGVDESDSLYSPVKGSFWSSPQFQPKAKKASLRQLKSPRKLKVGKTLEFLNPVIERPDSSLRNSRRGILRWEATYEASSSLVTGEKSGGIEWGSGHTYSTRSTSTCQTRGSDISLTVMNDTGLIDHSCSPSKKTNGCTIDHRPVLPRRKASIGF